MCKVSGTSLVRHAQWGDAACREEISQNRLNRIRGIQNLDRLDESLYQDFESDEARKVCAYLMTTLQLQRYNGRMFCPISNIIRIGMWPKVSAYQDAWA